MSDTSQITTPDKAPEASIAEETGPRFRVNDYTMLLKPRILSLVVMTGLVGTLMAPGGGDAITGLISVLCIAIAAGSAGAINMWYDRDIDMVMRRTQHRPIPSGRVDPRVALGYGLFLGIGSVWAMAAYVSYVAAGLLIFSIFYYVVIYTMWLKRRTPQNIVIGGAAGAFPPMIGWVAVTGTFDPGAIALFMIIFLWTPPHSWALALFRKEDYANASVPMLPVVAGIRETKKQMLIYTVLMIASTLAPVALGISGALFAVIAIGLNVRFWMLNWKVWKADGDKHSKQLFLYSILYLFLIFLAMVADRILFFPVF
jgi:protoheme IX farnesyltransferase